jgi:hypothetical protein
MHKNTLSKIKPSLPRKLIISLYCQNYTLSEIADKCNQEHKRLNRTPNVTTRDVYLVLHKSSIRWQERESQDRAELRAAELHKIDNLEREGWDAWFRSMTGAATHSTQSEKYNPSMDDDEDYDRPVDVDAVRKKWGDMNSLPGAGRVSSRGSHNNRRTNPAVVSIDAMRQTEFKTSKKIIETCGDPRYLKIVQWCIESRRTMLGLDAPARSITGTMTPEMMRQMAREMAPEFGEDPDLCVDEVLSEVQRVFAGRD